MKWLPLVLALAGIAACVAHQSVRVEEPFPVRTTGDGSVRLIVPGGDGGQVALEAGLDGVSAELRRGDEKLEVRCKDKQSSLSVGGATLLRVGSVDRGRSRVAMRIGGATLFAGDHTGGFEVRDRCKLGPAEWAFGPEMTLQSLPTGAGAINQWRGMKRGSLLNSIGWEPTKSGSHMRIGALLLQVKAHVVRFILPHGGLREVFGWQDKVGPYWMIQEPGKPLRFK